MQLFEQGNTSLETWLVWREARETSLMHNRFDWCSGGDTRIHQKHFGRKRQTLNDVWSNDAIEVPNWIVSLDGFVNEKCTNVWLGTWMGTAQPYSYSQRTAAVLRKRCRRVFFITRHRHDCQL